MTLTWVHTQQSTVSTAQPVAECPQRQHRNRQVSVGTHTHYKIKYTNTTCNRAFIRSSYIRY
jgi:hypothetical protein